jgi:hypothetical protein
MSETRQVYIIYRDGEVYACYLDHELAGNSLLDRMSRDPDEQYTWSITSYPIKEKS